MWGHKLAWGASELYITNKDPKVLQMATELGIMLVQRQNEEGTFPYPEWFPVATDPPTPKPFPDNTDGYVSASSSGLAATQRGPCATPASVTYSITAQATIWMSKVKHALQVSMAEQTRDIGAATAAAVEDGPAAKRAKLAGGY
jgi:hypothetical protein